MKFSIKKPCKNCPFLKPEKNPVTRGWLSAGRAESIIHSIFVEDQSFPCHKTTSFDDDGNECRTSENSACAGSLILQKKMGIANQISRIAMRLGMLDFDDLIDEDHVVDSPEEFIENHRNDRDN